MTNVLLLRNPSPEGSDRYHEYLESLGFVPHSIPVLDTALINVGLLKVVLLKDSLDYDGVIITSSRAAEAWKTAVEELIPTAESHADWSTIPFFVVGPTTADVLKAIPLSSYTPFPENIRGSESGDGESLAHFIIKDLHSTKPGTMKLLYLTGDKNRNILPTMLAQAGMELTRLQVYETRGSPRFASNLTNLINSQPTFEPVKWWIVFFAPSSTDFAMPPLQKHFTFPSSGSGSSKLNPRIAAIGPTTSSYLVNILKVKVDAVSPKPTPEALGHALLG